MFKYVIKRILQAVPTIFGVIVITFILFNVVGGSPASMTLGKHVSPRALEEFDEVRGANKPLFFGLWTTTRALEESAFSQNAGAWRATDGVEWDAGILTFEPGKTYPIPLAFGLRPETTYRLAFMYRHSGRVRLQWGDGCSQVFELPPSKKWSKARVVLDTVSTSADALTIEVEDSALELDRLSLRRKVAHVLDSQLVFYLKQLAHFDFGESNSTNQRISQMLKDGIIPSLILTVPIFFVGLVVSVSIALVCAYFRSTWLDRSLVVLSVILMSINYLVYIVVGQYVLAYGLGWFPIWGFESIRYLLLPVIIGTISGLGGNVRFYRTIMLDEMYKDYVRTAFAKGVSGRGVLFKHVLKNAMIPIVTNVVIAIPFLYTGSLLLESFFGIPGLGYMGINAINSSDIDVIRALVFIGAVLYVFANLLTDLCYALVDPRVKLG